MVPLPPTRWIFRSRWWAIAWCAGICLLAVEVSGGRQPAGKPSGASDSEAATTDAAIAQAARAMDAR